MKLYDSYMSRRNRSKTVLCGLLILLTIITVIVLCKDYLPKYPSRDSTVSPSSHYPKTLVDTELTAAHALIEKEAQTCSQISLESSLSLLADSTRGMRIGGTNGQSEIYSAFYDDRPIIGLEAVLQVVVASYKDDLLGDSLYCYVWYQNVHGPVVISAKKIETARTTIPSLTEVVEIQHLILSCPLKVAYPHPKYVSVGSRPCEPPNNLAPIFIPVRKTWNYEVGLCLFSSAAYGDPNKLIEWLEIYRLFGVEHVTLYDLDQIDEVNSVIKEYTLRGFVTVRSVAPPSSLAIKEALMSDHLQHVHPDIQNDCIMHSIYRYKFVILSNFDQILVPRGHATYQDMLTSLQQKAPELDVSFYKVPTAYYFKQMSVLFMEKGHLWVEDLVYRDAKIRDGPIDFQLIVNPRKCVHISKNSCLTDLTNEKTHVSHVLNSENVRSHVYRSCDESRDSCSDLKEIRGKDAFMHKYLNVLKKRVHHTIKLLEL